MDTLLKSLDEKSQGVIPRNAVFHRVTDWSYHVKAGDHVVTMKSRKSYVHHGIVLGLNDILRWTVADFSCPSGRKRDNFIRERDFSDFLAKYEFFGIVSYTEYDVNLTADNGDRLSSPTAASDDVPITTRCITVALARMMISLPPEQQRPYNLIYLNCECFALYCKTGTRYSTSDQVIEVLLCFQVDLNKGNDSLIFGTFGLVERFFRCV